MQSQLLREHSMLLLLPLLTQQQFLPLRNSPVNAKAKSQGANVPQTRSVLRPWHRPLRNGGRKDRSAFSSDSRGRDDGTRLDSQGAKRRRQEREGVTDIVPLRRPPERQGEPLRWHRKFGPPTCILELILQHTWLLVPYIALVVTLILVLQIRGL